MQQGIFIFCVILLMEVHSNPRDLYAGSKCHTSDTPGLCVAITNCPSALESVKKQGSHSLKRCGFEGFTEIVCCPNDLRHATTENPDDATDEEKKPEIRGPDIGRKSQKACDKYSKNVPIALSYHIVGGENAEKGEFPHMAALGFYIKEDKVYRFDCGGTLISNYYIVTAAHCIITVQQNEVKIARLGVIEIPASIEQPDSQLDYNVVNVTVHKEYKWKEKFNDIALVKLERKVTFTESIRPACLYTRSDDPERLFVTGWGSVSLGGERSSILQKAILNPVPVQECNSTYANRTNRKIIKMQICAADSKSDACQGDSGGPLQTQGNRSLWTIVGVTSYGIGCGSRYPGIYTRISSYVDWIEERVWP
ncbi:serine protease persephone-like isoform X1 [Tribolium madens]|uniref:serine protease persephone-like isoform X1 n=1 Tax=Tribolium madens TaxID=41895 RepID=UPI001CF7500F|nr:serine protease persephone-like isoform X1 [Tribolium madens]